MNMDSNPSSLYRKLIDGRALSEFPEDFFAPVEWVAGKPTIRTCRRKKTNIIESFYEWTIFLTRDFDIVPDYLNRIAVFYPNFYMMRFRSRQNNLLDIEIDSIYDLTSSAYNTIYIDNETLQESKKGSTILPSPDYRWGGTRVATVKSEDKDIIRKLIPVSLTLENNKSFGVIYDDVKNGRIKLPEVIDHTTAS